MITQEKFCIRARHPGDQRKGPAGVIYCKIGEDVEFNAAALEAFCFKHIGERDAELVLLAGVIAFTDRAVRRLAKRGWSRTLHIIMPVSEPGFWSAPAIRSSLVEALRFLTGDAWSFEFVKSVGQVPKIKQCELSLGGGPVVVIPYSNGLDSFAQFRSLKIDGVTASPILLTAWNRSLSGDKEWMKEAGGGRSRRVSIPVRVSSDTHAEQTYRTRSFLFATLSGLAARLSDAEAIIIPEAGQGAFGPSLVPVGGESPHRGSHPGLSRRMETFFAAFWGQAVPIRHPQLWRTKGEVLKRLEQNGVHDGWATRRSCSRDQRHLRTERHTLLQCGICSGCILRRLAVFASGLHEPADTYLWSNLKAGSMDEMLCGDALQKTSANDYDIAVHAILAMEELALQADRAVLSGESRNTLIDAFGTEPKKLEEASRELTRLLCTHKKEWRAFVAELGPQSWINQQIAMI